MGLDESSREKLKMAAEREGLLLTEADMEELAPLYASYQVQLEGLHAIDLGEEGPAVSYSPL